MGRRDSQPGREPRPRARARRPTLTLSFLLSSFFPKKAVGADILARLAEQRATLERARAAAAATGEAAGASNAILKKMGRWWPF